MNVLNKLPQNVQDIINAQIEVAHALGSITRVQEDNDGIGIIVDIYDLAGEEVLFTEAYEYSDYPTEDITTQIDSLRKLLNEKEYQFFTDEDEESLNTNFIEAPRVTYYTEYFYEEYAIKRLEYGRTILVPIGDADERTHTTLDDLSGDEIVYLASCVE